MILSIARYKLGIGFHAGQLLLSIIDALFYKYIVV